MHRHDAGLAKPGYSRTINPYTNPPGRQSDQPFVLIGQAKFLYDLAWQSQRACECSIDNCRYRCKFEIHSSDCDFNFRFPEGNRAITSCLPDHPSHHDFTSPRQGYSAKSAENSFVCDFRAYAARV